MGSRFLRAIEENPQLRDELLVAAGRIEHAQSDRRIRWVILAVAALVLGGSCWFFFGRTAPTPSNSLGRFDWEDAPVLSKEFRRGLLDAGHAKPGSVLAKDAADVVLRRVDVTEFMLNTSFEARTLVKACSKVLGLAGPRPESRWWIWVAMSHSDRLVRSEAAGRYLEVHPKATDDPDIMAIIDAAREPK